jgi:hypothetical protein
MSASRFAVFAAGFGLCSITKAPATTSRKPVAAPNWPSEPPNEIIVSRPNGTLRTNSILKITRTAHSNSTDHMDPTAWRIVFSTPNGTFYFEGEHVADDTDS